MQEAYKTILAIVVLLSGLGVYLSYPFLIYIGIGIGIASLLSAYFTEFLSKIYFKLIKAIGKINGIILLSLVFGLLILPYRLILKLSGRDILNDRTRDIKSECFRPDDLEKPF